VLQDGKNSENRSISKREMEVLEKKEIPEKERTVWVLKSGPSMGNIERQKEKKKAIFLRRNKKKRRRRKKRCC